MASSRNNALEFSSVGSVVINAGDGATAGSFGAGTILYGNFTSVTVSGAGSLVQLHIV